MDLCALEDRLATAFAADVKKRSGRDGQELPNSDTNIVRVVGPAAGHVAFTLSRLETPPIFSGSYCMVQRENGTGEYNPCAAEPPPLS